MSYSFDFTDKAMKQYLKLDKSVQRKIARYIERNIVDTDDPKLTGKALTGDYAGFWRYRIGSYRLICKIEDKVLKVLAIKIGHRSVVYTYRG